MNFHEVSTFINTKIGAGTIVDVTRKGIMEHPHFSTGNIVVDWITGIGGAPRSRLVELLGENASGKTSLALKILAAAQAAGLGGLYLDYENAIDLTYVQKLGVNLSPDLFALVQPNTMEDGFRIAECYMSNSVNLGVIVVDSVAAMATAIEKSENAEMGESQPGTQARTMSICLRQTKKLINTSGVCFIFINQLRSLLDFSWAGQHRAKMLGPQYTTPGGKAVKFYADMRIEFVPSGAIKEEGEGFISGEKEKHVVAQKIRVTVIKNRCAVPFRSGEILISHGKGINDIEALVRLAIRYEIIRQVGKQLIVPQLYVGCETVEQSFTSVENMHEVLENCPAGFRELRNAVWNKIKQEE